MRLLIFITLFSFSLMAEDKEFEVKSNGGYFKFERIEINEKAIQDILKRLDATEKKLKILEKKVNSSNGKSTDKNNE